MKQEERKQMTIGRLLDATKELIREKGCASITMNDIMDRSKLSKGAIFHHVRSKDEIFAWVLHERLEETDKRFTAETEREVKTFEGPLSKIAEDFAALEDGQDVTNKVLAYLLGKEEDPAVGEALGRYYEQTAWFSRQWIESGQRHGVIPDTVDAGKMGDLFVLISLGLRVRSSIPGVSADFAASDFTGLIRSLLQSHTR
ncbi:TetR family transcriptional regulator [Cohnella sp. CIP 111063]|uniref:TetR/AcrR family transcriptional regulator n=1 Tax=unclassified Cohnella TaxID=2636738 RepID=UPI000B8C6AE5|nr:MULTISPECIES: TetR/AcrR family transcriptional regulator [unclassified Cohnella]OXS62689.1 TetR family transcriptional regulator [Cohnella sp. CIP 111063]PRX74956.1 TetR family transcriptional regulator [Cohnella sp. SGD-V74]